MIISLKIENTYELYADETTYVVDKEIPDPPAEREGDEWDAWVQENIYDSTGVGHPDGDSWYDVRVLACSDPNFVGMTFDFGY